MRNKFGNLLLSILISLAVLLGLSFWLNTVFGFNLFNPEHWKELSSLQAEQIPINDGFYISIGVAIFVWIFALISVYLPTLKHTKSIKITPPIVPQQTTRIEKEPAKSILPQKPERYDMPLSRPPQLKLPSNMAQVIRQQHYTVPFTQNQKPNDSHVSYDSDLAKIFMDNGYTVKPNPTISGFTPNLFAIAPDEILWIGAVDSDINKLQSAVDRLQNIFQDTLEDIQINISAFMIDTKNQQHSTNSVNVFKSLDELKTFLSNLPSVRPEDMKDYGQENFDAYSEYIDTIIQYVKNMG